MLDVEKLEKICQKITKLDPKMRSARIINSRGHMISGGMKDGLLSLEAQKQDEMMFMELALRVRMRHEFDSEFGLDDGMVFTQMWGWAQDNFGFDGSLT